MSDCREYQVLTTNGYGQVGKELRKKYGTELASRVVWIMVHGSIPPGKEIRHLCGNRACVLLEHLAIGTHDDNMKDYARSNAFCRNGHLLIGDNVFYEGSSNVRRCRQCKNANAEARRNRDQKRRKDS